MNHDSTLLTAVAMGDAAAAETLTERYAGPLFRFCRLNFTDHYRAGEFIDEFLAGWIFKLRKGSIPPGTILDLFREAFRQSSGRWVGERGRGLSAKQRRILEIMEQVPLDSRIALDLFYLEDKSGEEIARSLGIEPESIGSIASEFFNMLASDDTIKEFLKHALIHQSREKQTAGRKDRPEPLQRERGQATTIFASGERQERAGTSGRPGFGTRRPEGFSPRETRRETGSEVRRETDARPAPRSGGRVVARPGTRPGARPGGTTGMNTDARAGSRTGMRTGTRPGARAVVRTGPRPVVRPAPKPKTPAQIQSADASQLMKSVRNLGPGAGVWTRVNSILTSDRHDSRFFSVCNGFEGIVLEGTDDVCPVHDRSERIRWYERM